MISLKREAACDRDRLHNRGRRVAPSSAAPASHGVGEGAVGVPLQASLRLRRRHELPQGRRVLDGYGDLEDWGCGTAYASKFVRASAYRGVDGSAGYADVVADLRLYRSRTPCLLMRHVLEHDLEWCKILDNAIASFERRMVLVVFTPFAEQTRVLKVGPSEIPDIAFAKRELLARIPSDCRVSEESLQTRSTYGREHLFYIDRPAPGEAPARLRV